MNIAIIVAAGTGSRFSKDKPKQFEMISGRPLIAYTIERFAACPYVDKIVLVLSEDGKTRFEEIRDEIECSKPLTIAGGGDSRAASVRNGLTAATVAPNDIVAVHDGARPLVTEDEIARTIQKAAETGAACLCLEVTDTIKSVDGDAITGTIDRNTLRRAVTPQAFRADLLLRAFDMAAPDEAITDEAMLVERLGFPVSVLEGNSRNIKVTRMEDIAIVEKYLEKSRLNG